MTPQINEQKVRQIIEEYVTNYANENQYDVSPIPYHTHNGTDSPLINGIGGGGFPAGSDMDVQFNNDGFLGGSDNFKWDNAESLLKISNASISTGPTPTSLEIGYNSNVGSGATIASASFTGLGDGQFGESIDIWSGKGRYNGGDGAGGDFYVQSGNVSNGASGGNILATEAYVWLRGANFDNQLTGGAWVAQAGFGATGGGDGGEMIFTSGGSNDFDAGDVTFILSNGNASTGKDSRFVLGNDLSNPATRSYRIVSSIKTTNATPTNSIQSVMRSFTGTTFVEARVVAKRTGGGSGTAQDSAAYVRRACYKYDGVSGLSLVGAIQDDFTVEDQAAWDCTFTTSGTEIFLQVTGAANNNITWEFELFYIQI